MENPPFLKVMTKVFILLFVLISVLILYVLLAEGAGENFFFISVITLYPFIYAIVGNLLGYYIYKRNKIGMVVISMIILLMIYIPTAMYIVNNSWFYSFLELFFFCLRFFITITLSLIVFFLSIYVFKKIQSQYIQSSSSVISGIYISNYCILQLSAGTSLFQ